MKTHLLNNFSYQEDIAQQGLPIKKSWILKLLLALLIVWFGFPFLMQLQDPSAGYIDQNIWLLLVFSLITFLIVTALSWWLLKQFWVTLGLPNLNQLFVHFKNLPLCQQLNFCFALFALFMLAAIGCILAIC